MCESEIALLAETIRGGIAVRGIYLLADDRLELVCGAGALENLEKPEVAQKIAQFAAANGWAVTRYQLGFVFWPPESTILDGPKRAPNQQAAGTVE